MATSDLTSSIQTRYGTSSSWNSWTTYNVNNGDYARFYLGSSSSLGNCRFQMAVTIPSDITIASTNKLIVAWKADSAITPKYIRGFLSTTAFGPNTDNWTASSILDVSNLWLDTDKTTQFTSYYSSNYPWGYFVFDSVSVTAGTTYYISVASYASNYGENTTSISSNSGSGVWCRGRNMSGYVSAELDYINTVNMDVNMYISGDDWYYSGDGINKFNAVVGGTTVASNANDLNHRAVPGTSYSITPIAGTGYYNYNDTVPITGTYGNSDFSVALYFAKNYGYISLGPDGGVVTGSGYSIIANEWIYKNDTNPIGAKYYGDTVTLPTVASMGLHRPGYTFSHWQAYHDGYGVTGLTYSDGGTYNMTEFHDRFDSSLTVSNYNGVNCALIAIWVPNSYTITLDPNGGSIDSTSQTVNYSNGKYTSLPTPTLAGKKFKGWFADIGNNGPIHLGRDYMLFKSATGIGVSLDAYMEDWSSVGTATLISCTNNGGWNLWFNSGSLISEVWDSVNGAYTTINVGVTGSELSSGWHRFGISISESVGIMIDVDGKWNVISSTLGELGYYRYNSMWLGAEASGNATAYDDNIFPGLIRNFTIENKYTGITSTLGGFAIPCQDITLYADWETAPYMYVKVDGEWKLGQAGIKLGDDWVGIDSITSLKRTMYVSNLGDHDFVLGPDGWYRNTNQYFSESEDGGIESVCLAKVRFYLPSATNVAIEYYQDSEMDYDYGILSLIDTTLDSNYYYYYDGDIGEGNSAIELHSGPEVWSDTYDYGSIAAGWHNIYIKYQKDSSVDSGTDTFKFRLIFT